MPNLAHAIALAAEAHKHQRDRAGRAYILHPLRLMFQMTDENAMIVAILHDVVEDTEWTLDDLREEGFTEEVLFAVDCLTKRKGEPYGALIERAKQSPLAARVKIADLRDNMDVTRLRHLNTRDTERLLQYHTAWSDLTAFLAETSSRTAHNRTDGSNSPQAAL